MKNISKQITQSSGLHNRDLEPADTFTQDKPTHLKCEYKKLIFFPLSE